MSVLDPATQDGEGRRAALDPGKKHIKRRDVLLAAGAASVSAALAACTGGGKPFPGRPVDLSPARWPAGELERYQGLQSNFPAEAGVGTGRDGAVTVVGNAFAARAGLEALKQGGSAVDAALTGALTQVALTLGGPVSYFGLLSLTYYDATSGKVHTMDAEWNTVAGELEPLTIPGGSGFNSPEEMRGLGTPSGRTALVGGFMKGVGAAHRRFGKLPFAALFDPAIYVAETGLPVEESLLVALQFRGEDLARLPATKAVFFKSDGSPYQKGDVLRQTALAQTLRNVASQGVDYMYTGPWAEKLIGAVRADGGHMTMKDLAAYQVVWQESLVAEQYGGYALHLNGNLGGVGLIESFNLAEVSKLADYGPWWKSGTAVRMAADITSHFDANFLPAETIAKTYPGMDFSPAARVTRKHAEELWRRMQAGAKLGTYLKSPHSDSVVAVDRWGNMAALTHSINTISWGKTAINIDGISIGDPASFQQQLVSSVKPGSRLPSPVETGVLFKDGKPVVAFAAMGAGMHQRTFPCLTNVIRHGMTVSQAINAPDLLYPVVDSTSQQATTIQVPAGRFDKDVLEAIGYAYREDPYGATQGYWVAISRDPQTGKLEAACANRSNGAAVAY
ncbi:gamma-glutamyltransferase family protein [Allokutzneria sp. A3M-2-11 16]|uniref:gamma-glutamyltransferase n=1 Tax=Allokutzneria sp. A3M-2-11 16 TaxID=2962043 RepID=UPI0020B69F51|nr:gamma-glutamyltransferase [Allokutzneria sp. A3M-2-11 16]MCP3802018.1 gamma-glutamyltransferase family protein [Allokutzneria sp. A3M-2-11 16]